MDIKCKTNPYYFLTPSPKETPSFSGVPKSLKVAECVNVGKFAELCEDKFVRRPVASKSATGLLGFVVKCKDSVKNYVKNYKKNIEHTYDHKMVFALIEKELYGKNSLDSITHDLDKLILYTLGFPKSIVSRLHRNISVHHVESGRKNNLRSMLCDNIASSPEFKPEKKLSLRDYYNSSKELQQVEGFKEILEKYNYGENIDFNAIRVQKKYQQNYIPRKALSVARALSCFIF